jgi:nucleoside-diphosphate-sugar epimerase
MKGRVLITGASGFVGYHVVKEALKKELEVFAAVRPTSVISHLKDFNIQFTYLDFREKQSLIADFSKNKYDYIIHLAGLTKALTSKEYDDVNAYYVQNIAYAIVESGIAIKKFVLMSSLAAIGPLDTLDGSISENKAPSPVTTYGKSKLLGETLLKKFNQFDYTILRPTAVYGPRDKDMFIFFKQISQGFELYIGKQSQKLSFIYVIDLAQASIKALNAPEKSTYILTDGFIYNREELAKQAKETLEIKTLRINIPLPIIKLIASIIGNFGTLTKKATTLNPEKVNELIAKNWGCDISLSLKELNYNPRFNLKNGIKNTFAWYKNNNWL